MSTKIRGSQLEIEQVLSDPVAPQPGQLWVLKVANSGKPLGMLLALTYSTNQYQLSYKTSDGTIVRTGLV